MRSELEAAIRSGRGDAVTEAGRRTSYADLLANAEGLAAALRGHGAGPGTVVPVQGVGTTETVTQIVAVVLTGAAYAPVDSRTPDRTVAAFARLCGASVVLGSRRDAAHGVRWIDSAAAVGEAGDTPWVSRTVPATTAYVIATSGTSGAPKGVVVPESAVLAYLGWAMAEYGGGYGAPLFTSLGFDLTVTSLLGPLVSGRTVAVLDPVRWPLDVATDPRPFDEAGFVKLTPSQLDIVCRLMTETGTRSGAPVLVVGGEAMRGSALARWRDRFPAAAIVNEYGPSEAAVGCCRYTVPDGFAGDDVPIGTPPPGVGLELAPLPEGYAGPREPGGEHGELVITGAQVATGYLIADAAGRGVLAPFAARAGQRRYPSGDHVSRRTGGLFTYHGRIGREVKVNGFRVNLAAVESRLADCPGVLAAAVAAGPDGLTARVAANPEVTARTVRRHLLEFLPVYAVPAKIAVGPEIAVTERGKLAADLSPTHPEDRS
ncbi:AMP-binding protein [Amycolatopsis sp. PS_44_ISF1]|uniref:AMP-binding protein n=1 Tax=Amycolatopsis sp. PS_44_ISF1 TaxID=2974917 RepID=UPI0028DF0AC3|nr:AMP-binding protein [Amycolatopsis sp. PS_44_ISF1]MDT8914976.1 AMP-binding protein [Amycolatopsis sp. PS_44_ISF1]